MKRRKKKKNRLKSSFAGVTKNFIYLYIYIFSIHLTILTFICIPISTEKYFVQVVT